MVPGLDGDALGIYTTWWRRLGQSASTIHFSGPEHQVHDPEKQHGRQDLELNGTTDHTRTAAMD